MYATARRMALISAICCAGNILGVILLFMCSAGIGISFAISFSIAIVLGTSAAVNLMITLGLRSLCQDLQYEYEDNFNKFHQVHEKIKEIEKKM